MSDERQAFEQLHAIPSGAIWCENRDVYIHKNYSGMVLHPINESWEAFCEGVMWQASRQALEGEAVDVERIADTVRDHLGDIFACTRVWEAWQVGTMTQNDFTPADETELADDIAGAVATLYTHPVSADVPDAEYIRVLQDACNIIQADANTEQNYRSLCRIGSVLAKLKATPTKADDPAHDCRLGFIGLAPVLIHTKSKCRP